MDALEILEKFRKQPDNCINYEEGQAIDALCRECRAAREAVIACRTGNRADSPVYDDFEYIAEKMKEAEHG